jgi:hypothetical protein
MQQLYPLFTSLHGTSLFCLALTATVTYGMFEIGVTENNFWFLVMMLFAYAALILLVRKQQLKN